MTKRPPQIDIKEVKDKKTLSKYLQRIIWVAKQREGN